MSLNCLEHTVSLHALKVSTNERTVHITGRQLVTKGLLHEGLHIATVVCLLSEWLQHFGHVVLVYDCLAGLVLAAEVPNPAGHREGQVSKFRCGRVHLQLVDDARRHEDIHLLAAVLAQARDLVTQLRVREPVNKLGFVGSQVDPGDLRHGGSALIHVALDETVDHGVTSGLVYLAVAVNVGKVGESRVRSVQKSKFHQLVWNHILDEKCARRTPVRPTSVEVVFNDPLQEILSDNRPLINEATKVVLKLIDIGLSRGRSDSIDHGVGEAHVSFNPVSEVLIVQRSVLNN